MISASLPSFLTYYSADVHLCIVALETLPDLDVELLNGHHVLLLSGCLQVAVLQRELDHLSLYHFARVMV